MKDYFKGDLVEMTGKSRPEGPVTFEEFVYIEGHRTGQTGWKLSKADKDAQAEAQKAAWHKEQAEFRAIHKGATA